MEPTPITPSQLTELLAYQHRAIELVTLNSKPIRPTPVSLLSHKSDTFIFERSDSHKSVIITLPESPEITARIFPFNYRAKAEISISGAEGVLFRLQLS